MKLAVMYVHGVEIGPWWPGRTPLTHPFHRNDKRVMTPIATSLARARHRTRAAR